MKSQTIPTVNNPKHTFSAGPRDPKFCAACGNYEADTIHNGTPDFEARIWREATEGFEPRDYSNPSEEPKRKTFPASWAVYDAISGLLIDYCGTEDSARFTADKWSAGKMPQEFRDKAESGRELRAMLKPGDTVSVIQRHVSRSGMMRRLSLLVVHNGELVDITWHAARVMGDSVKQRGAYVQDAGMVVEGCGMDMHFHIVYNLSRTLFPDGFGVEVTHPMMGTIRPVSREMAVKAIASGYIARGRNGDGSGWDTDGGYALNKRTI